MTKLEKHSPELRALCEALNLSVYYRGGEWWCGSNKGGMDDVQLTYRRDCRGGKDIPVTTMDHRVEIALCKLRRIEAGRKQPRWGTLTERYRRVSDALRDEIIPAYRPGNYCYFVDDSLDCGYCFSALPGGAGQKHVTISLVGMEPENAEARTFEDALAKLVEGKD